MLLSYYKITHNYPLFVNYTRIYYVLLFLSLNELDTLLLLSLYTISIALL